MGVFCQQEKNNGNSNKSIGCFLVFLMIIIASLMVYSIFMSWRKPTSSVYVTPSYNKKDPIIFSSSSPSPLVKSTPLPNISPKISPKLKPKSKPKISSISSPIPKQKKEKRFYGSHPDGPPYMDRAYGNMFKGKSGVAYIAVKSSSKDWKGVRAYLIDKKENVYWVLKFKYSKEENAYIIKVPPGKNYKVKFVKSGYFTYKDDIPPLENGLIADIKFPMERRPSFNIKTNPSGAKVYFDNKLAGITPTVVKNLNSKKYSIKVVKAGYKVVKLSITFKRGIETIKSIKMKRK